ncbi:MAG: DUF4159 domain-containing protein [Verrucomicrobia bacterium]|nr:DUF4159 domain-containing protein [Verrucomicrobiota bacterium]
MKVPLLGGAQGWVASRARIRWFLAAASILGLCAATAVFGQFRSRRQQVFDRGDVPRWEVDPQFSRDVFTFVRIRYNSSRGWGRWEKWTIDYPDSDLNFSFRLQQLTSLKVDPDGKIFGLTDKELFDYPFIYIVEPGDMVLENDEVTSLRRYLLNGGFLMVDDFWGEREWDNFYREIKRVFPDREPINLPMDHPVFHCVFPLKMEKNKLQVPNFQLGEESQYHGVTWERSDAQEVHFRAIFDDKGRMMVMICHNTDNGDGWEREGVYQYYFREFSEKKAYPLGINIVFYAMTH